MSYPLSLPASAPLLTLTNPKPSLWVIELHNGQDSRLTDTLINHGLMPALNAVEKHWREQWSEAKAQKSQDAGGGALIIVGKNGQDKFFSNGLDFVNASKDPSFFPQTFNPMLVRLLTFPIPTIAAINGHAFAAGFILALACDYRVMADGSKRNAWLCMNEVHFGAVWPLSLAATVRAKVASAQVQRSIALEGYRFPATEALKLGLVDHIVPTSSGEGGLSGLMGKCEELAGKVGPVAKGGVWGLIKEDMYRDALDSIKKDLRMRTSFIQNADAKARL